jgi:WD40 repeat protein
MMARRQRRIAGGVMALFAAALAVACGGSDQGPRIPEESGPRVAFLQIAAGAAIQMVSAGSAVPANPTVRVLDSLGSPVANVTVTFAILDGAGTVSAASVPTDVDGLATTRWTLGQRVGVNALTASVAGLPSVQFTAKSLPILTIEAGGTSQNAVVGTAVATAPAVVARDALGAPVADFQITFTGDGTVSPATLTTGSDGRAQAASWTLSTVSGAQSLYAWPGATVIVGTSVQFQATALPGPATRIVLTRDNVAIPVGATPADVTLYFVDVYGNRTSDVGAISFASSNESTATVSELGTVKPVAPGWSTITVSAGPLSASVPVMVFDRISGLGGAAWGLALLDDNTALVTVAGADSDAVKRVDLRTGAVVALTNIVHYSQDITLDAKRSVAYVASMWDAVTAAPLSGSSPVVAIPDAAVRVQLSPNGQRIYAGNFYGGIAVIDPSTQTVVAQFGELTQPTSDPNATPGLRNWGTVEGLAVSPDGATLYVAGDAGSIGRINAADGKILTWMPVFGRPEGLVLSADGSVLYAANETGTDALGGWVDALDAATLQLKKRVHVGSPYSMALSPDGQTLVVGGAQGGDGGVHSTRNPRVTILDRATMTVVAVFDIDGGRRRVAFTSDGRAVMTNTSGAIDILPAGRP